MMKRIAACMLILGCVLFTPQPAHAQSAAEQEFLFAYRLMQRGDLTEAGAAFDDFLEKFPQDAARGDALYLRAALYRQAGALRAAAEVLQGVGGAGTAEPQRVPRYAVDLLRGQVLTDLGEFDAALTVLETVDTSALPANAEASVSLLKALAYRGAGNHTAAAAAAEAAAASPGVGGELQARALLEQARAQAAAGQADAARATLDRALAAGESAVSAEASRLAGDVAYAAGDDDDAAGYYQRVIEREQSSPEFPAAVVGRMWADLRAGRNIGVVNTHKQLADLLPDPARPEADYLAASAYQNLGQQAQAVELLTQVAAATAPESTADSGQPATSATPARSIRPLALYKLAVGQFDLTRYDDMTQTVTTLEREFPDSPQRIDAGFLLATAEAKQGRAAEGVARLQPFIDGGPDNPYHAQALLRRASLYEQTGELQAAADDLSRYLDTTEADPAQLAIRLRLADLQHRLGAYDAAIATSEAILSDPQAAATPALQQEALYRLGEARTRAGQFREALATFDQLQRQHPINPHRHAVDLRRGLLLQQLGRTDEAMAVLIEAGNDERLPADQRVAALRIIAAHLRDHDRPDDAAVTLGQIERLAGLEALRDAELLWLADHQVQRGEPAAALRTLAVFDGQRRTLDEGPAEAELRFTRGRAHFDRGELEEAYRQFFGVVALGQGFDLDARLYLARTEAQRGNLDAALGELNDLTRVADSRVQAQAMYEAGVVHRQRAELLRRRGDEAGAAEQLAAARASLKRMVLLFLTVDSLRPLPERGLVQLAEVATLLDEPAARDKELEELTRSFPDSPYAEYGRAVLDQQRRQRPDDALVRLQRMDRATLDPVLRDWVSQKIDELEALR